MTNNSKFLDELNSQSSETQPDLSGGSFFLADSQQPEDVYQQLDTSYKNMVDNIKTEPYTASAYNSLIQNIPILDRLTKEQLAQGDTTNLKEVYTTPALNYINQRLFNYPRAIMESIGKSFPESKTEIGNILSKSAGISGALQNIQVGQGVANAIKPIAGKSVLKSTARGAVAGAVEGAIYSPENVMDPKARLKQAMVGGVLGALIVPVTNRIANFISKKALRGNTTLRERIIRRRSAIDAQTQLERVQVDKNLDEVISLAKDSEKSLQDNLAIQQVQGKIPNTKTAFTRWSRDLSNLYETSVDDISNTVGDIDAVNTKEFYGRFLSDLADDPELANTTAAKKIQRMYDDLSKEDSVTLSTSFKKLNEQRKSILSGKYKGNVEDVVKTRFRKEFLNYVSEIEPTGLFKKLNETMAPQLEFKHQFLRKLHVYDKYETSGIEALYKKYAAREMNPKGITLGERMFMDDALKYMRKYGITSSDIDAIYAKSGEMSSKAQELTSKKSALSAAHKIEDINRNKIRINQNAKLSRPKHTELGRLAYQTFTSLIRLSLVWQVLNMSKALKGGLGFETPDENLPSQ